MQAGKIVRRWREARRLSQLDLALEVDVSPRHLSCVETGKARASAPLLERLAETLAMPLRERNGLLLAAGFAPSYRETPLSAPEMANVRRAVELILAHQEPFPAFVADRYWNVLDANPALQRLLGTLLGRPPRHENVLHQIFDPADVRPLIVGWEQLAASLLVHLHHDMAKWPADEDAQKLWNELMAYPDVPENWRWHRLESRPLPTIETRFKRNDGELSFFSTLTTFPGAHDVTLDEIRVECMYPADARTSEFCCELTKK